MCAEVDVFISNYTLVDPEIYQLWVEGHTATEAVNSLNLHGLGQTTGATLELIASDVLDHYRTYSLIEKLLSNPNKLQEQLEFQIEPQTKQLLIEKYYDFDDSVIRELLGKKLSSRNRKDLDEVAEKTGVPLKSCRRQFDNVKRIYKTVEELPGSITQNIQKLFYLPEELAGKYACIVFLACIRFETSKRRLQYLKFAPLQKCTEIIMNNWTYSVTAPEYYDTEMDKEFLLDLRELRILTEREKEHKHLVCVTLKPTLLSRNYTELDSNFRVYSRSILTIASSLHRSRELRNLFVEISQILEIWRQNGWGSKDLQLFLSAYTQCALELDVLREVDLKTTWERYMKVLSHCIMIMFN
ncbi:PREDICTED: acidic fibroblast growth factor intracellular-binding protein [Nicrophorus vespilloides]|uniref:Acidic fibroblast growth factor intracellular-binding protein n=1 Tax=Nicrophorus vespilloides TaxID=110193 RepID=A0ABM1MY94_NICVS|nr:PREDICTED: acidic fibroblast growth factor intracellular-binding protein [Nicrophorus vespilloides]